MIGGPLRVSKPGLHLTPMQKRYQADPERCLATLEQRADRLFEDGYVAIAGSAPLVFIVGRGDRGRDPRDGSVQYFVHAVHKSCSCPFFSQQNIEPLTEDGTVVLCKHLRGLEKLVRQSVTHFKNADDLYTFFKLLCQWMAVMAEHHRLPSACKSPACSTSGAPTAATAAVCPMEIQKGISE